jgi:transposase
MVRSGRSVKDVSEALGMTEQSLRNWVRQEQRDRHERDDGLTTAEREELRELRRKVRRLEQERDLLKRAAAFRSGASNPAQRSELVVSGRIAAISPEPAAATA